MPEGDDPSGNISSISIEEEMKKSYLDYAMSVIVSRALPDVRDGLKPVHRRILYAMHESGYHSNRPYRKSARIVGDVIGKYHPHGDQAIYDAMVRMAQQFSMRLPLVDGQGNFGSIDGDPPAAMRYTEVRMAQSAHALIEDIDKETVDFVPNYDGSEREPSVLPARLPNLLVNGASGIAVGMATNMPPHNLGEVIEACCAYIDNPDISINELITYVPAPDFPTGGIIMGTAGARAAYHKGRGSVVMRGKTAVEEIRKDREAIIITEIPFLVNKAVMIQRIAEAVQSKRIEGISDLRDESDRDGIRVVIELKRDATAEVVLNQLYRYSSLQSTFGMNMLALNGGRPEVFDLKSLIATFIAFREQVITRRLRFELGKARDRAHVLVGLAIAVTNVDEMIRLIRAAPNPATAREQILARTWPVGDFQSMIELINDPGSEIVDGGYRFSEVQARAILDLRLNRLTALGRDEIGTELIELAAKIEEFLVILGDRDRLIIILRAELRADQEKFATPRRTRVEEHEEDFDDEDLIQHEEMVVTFTNAGYIKRVPLSTYRTQRRGGRGRSGMSTREEDFVKEIFVADTHTPLLFFTSVGKVYKIKVWKLPVGSPQARGKAVINLLPLSLGETIATVMPLPEDEDSWADLTVMFATAKGNVRRNTLADFVNVMANGKWAIQLDDDDQLIGVAPCSIDDDILLAARSGKSIRFAVGQVRVFKSRTSSGIRGMRLAPSDKVISLSVLSHVRASAEQREAYVKISGASRRGGEDGDNAEVSLPDVLDQETFERMAAAEQFVLSVTENGFGKRTSCYEYRTVGRGGQGVINIETTERNGNVVGSFPVEDGDQLILTTDTGRLIRCPVDDIRIAGRVTQGVKLFAISEGEQVVSVTCLTDSGEADEPDDADDADGIEAADTPESPNASESDDTDGAPEPE